jgi:hypothetical protein
MVFWMQGGRSWTHGRESHGNDAETQQRGPFHSHIVLSSDAYWPSVAMLGVAEDALSLATFRPVLPQGSPKQDCNAGTAASSLAYFGLQTFSSTVLLSCPVLVVRHESGRQAPGGSMTF